MKRWFWAAGRQLCPIVVLAALVVGATGAADERLARAQELLDSGEPQAALELLDAIVKKRARDPQALLLRSTARFMLGDLERGREDLDRALAEQPGLRQGWLNRAALDVAEGRYDEALQAFLRAEELDPSAADNDLNIGAVLLLQDGLGPASERFDRYLRNNPYSSDAFYLVATNYAIGGYATLAVEHLRRAIEIDEKTRLRARTDANFAELGTHPQFQEILANDSYRLPPGAHFASRFFDAPYAGGNGRLLDAVIEALQFSSRPLDRRIEVTPSWALIWSDLRVKVSGEGEGRGAVELSAPAERFTPSEWEERSEALFREITARLIEPLPRAGDPGGPSASPGP